MENSKPVKSNALTSNQALMHDKLAADGRVLEGITLYKFDQVEESDTTLSSLCRNAVARCPQPVFGGSCRLAFERVGSRPGIFGQRHALERRGFVALKHECSSLEAWQL